MPNIKIKVDPQETKGVKVNTTATAMTINALGLPESESDDSNKVRFLYNEDTGYPISKSINFVNALMEDSNDGIIYFTSPSGISTTTAGMKGYNVSEEYTSTIVTPVVARNDTGDEYYPIIIIPEEGHVVSVSTDNGETWSVITPFSYGVRMCNLYSRKNITHVKLSKAGS